MIFATVTFYVWQYHRSKKLMRIQPAVFSTVLEMLADPTGRSQLTTTSLHRLGPLLTHMGPLLSLRMRLWMNTALSKIGPSSCQEVKSPVRWSSSIFSACMEILLDNFVEHLCPSPWLGYAALLTESGQHYVMYPVTLPLWNHTISASTRALLKRW